MICITINQESRRFALVDMHNASKQCDLLEIRLDRFGMAPELAELIAHKPKPVIMSCRRKSEGGAWDGTEAERLALLRQAIVNRTDYVEIELDAADEILRMAPSKRVISFVANPQDKAADIHAAYELAKTKDPDVIKITTSATTPEEAWPLVQILAKPSVPTVVVGTGKSGVMLALLARKIGAPWTYAALEKGMEAYPGQPTVSDLRDTYDYTDIHRGTRLIGVTGFGEKEYYTVAGLNAALKHLEITARCLPMGVGSAKLFERVADAVKLSGVVVDPEHQGVLLSMADQQHPTVEYTKATDLLLLKGEDFHAYFTTGQGAVAALAETLKRRRDSDEPLRGRVVMITGITPATYPVAAELQHRKANVILASFNEGAAKELAQKLGCRYVKQEAMYSTLYDTLVVCAEEKVEKGKRVEGLHPTAFKENVTVLDMTAAVRSTVLLQEASIRGSFTVPPREVLIQQLDLRTKLITNKDVPREVFEAAIPDLDNE